MPNHGTPASWIGPTAEHPTHHGPAKPWNILLIVNLPHSKKTLLTLNLPHRGTPYSPWACPTVDHPTHRGPAPPRNTLISLDLLHMKTTDSLNGRKTLKKSAREGDRQTERRTERHCNVMNKSAWGPIRWKYVNQIRFFLFCDCLIC